MIATAAADHVDAMKKAYELMEEAGNGDVVVQMSMYSDNEQVGSLGKVLYPVSIDAGDGNKNGTGNFFIIFRMNLF